MEHKDLDIYTYTDYRTFLGDAFRRKKQTNPLFSYRVFSRIVGVKSPNYLKNIIDRKRSMGFELAGRVSSVFKLTDEETRYFMLLVKIAHARDDFEKELFEKELIHFSNKKERLHQTS